MTGKLAELIGGRKKSVAAALRPDATIATAEAALDHALSGTNGKRIGVDDVDAILDELGPEKEAEFMRFFTLRRGWKAPERMSTAEWALHELAEIKRRLEARDELNAEVRDQVERVEAVLLETLEGRR